MFSITYREIHHTPSHIFKSVVPAAFVSVYFKHDIFLVEGSTDGGKISGIFHPEMIHITSGIAHSRGLIEGIFSALQAKGILDDAGIEQIKQQANSEIEGRRREFTKVNDLDQWA
jgi:hypothetical protein